VFLCSGGITLTVRRPIGNYVLDEFSYVLSSAAFCDLELSSFSQNFSMAATASFTARTKTVTLVTPGKQAYPIGTYTATLKVVSRCCCHCRPATACVIKQHQQCVLESNSAYFEPAMRKCLCCSIMAEAPRFVMCLC
jgi:hypothetical protein